MANVIQLVDGSIHTLFHEWDILDLVDEQMGYEAREAIKDLLLEKDYDESCVEDLESELEGMKDHHREVMEQLQKQSETIAGLIREKEIDRKALSKVAGIIGSVTWREINVR